MKEIEVKKVEFSDVKPFLLEKHYAHRIPSISYAYGLFYNDKLEGVVTYGTPASRSLQIGFFGEKYAKRVIELNRLYINDYVSQHIKNVTSFFVAESLRQLKKYNLLVVSFADSGMNHIGGIYQACNFIYLGKTPTRTDKFTGFNKHSRHYDKGGVELIRVIRSSKYKYIYYAMDKRTKKKFKKIIRYKAKPYPKDLMHKHYRVGDKKEVEYVSVKTGETIDENEARKIIERG